MVNATYEWLAKYYKTDTHEICDALQDENASSFLIVWSIFEQKLFDGYCKKCDITNYADEYVLKIDMCRLDMIAAYFHKRYQDKNEYGDLTREDKYSVMEDILEKTYNILSDKEKLILAIYVVYRYRNNIFHGNKSVMTWTKYTKQIGYCLDIMVMLLESIQSSPDICDF